MHVRTLSLALLAAVSLSACGTQDLAVTGPERSPEEPRGHHTSNYCVRFNVPPVGAIFGAPVPNPPGTVVFVEQSIPVSVNKFLLSTGVWTYNWMRIEPAPAVFGLASGNTGHTNNINAGFDFTGLPFVTTKVVFHFMDLGGHENLNVNGSPMFVGQITAPPAAIAGIGVSSVFVGVPGGTQGTVTLTGSAANPIKRFQVGGQELWLDTICAYP